MPNPPSIPSHDNVFGYEENIRGELIRQSNTEIVYQGTQLDSVGPGNYELTGFPDKKKVGTSVKWSKPPGKTDKMKAIQDEKEGVKPGPGHYRPINSGAVYPLC